MSTRLSAWPGIRGYVCPNRGELIGQVTIVVVIDVSHHHEIRRPHRTQEHRAGGKGKKERKTKDDRPRTRPLWEINVRRRRINQR